MSFISYAQNYEDVMLWRALKHVQHGFYIDVGANDPTDDSVTKAFYDRGWRGINVEPLKSHHQDLLEARPNDINLLCAAGAQHGQIDIWECDVRGWATASGAVIQKHGQDGHAGIFHRVSLFPLGDICEQYAQAEIHFLKIDVEGFEKDVLQGMNFKKFRPWIVVVEATKPNSTEDIHETWESLIVENNYVFAYADGVNRFYVSAEQSHNLLDVLRYPPNVFDGYIRVQQLDSEIRAQASESKAQQAQEQATQAEAKAHQAQEQATQADAKAQQAQAALVAHMTQLHAVYSSTSWRITAPLRWVIHQLRLLRDLGFKQRAKAAFEKVLRKVVPWIVARPKLKSLVSQLVYALGFDHRLKSLVRNLLASHQQSAHQDSSQQIPTDLTTLTSRARQIYHDLKLGIEIKQRGG